TLTSAELPCLPSGYQVTASAFDSSDSGIVNSATVARVTAGGRACLQSPGLGYILKHLECFGPEAIADEFAAFLAHKDDDSCRWKVKLWWIPRSKDAPSSEEPVVTALIHRYYECLEQVRSCESYHTTHAPTLQVWSGCEPFRKPPPLSLQRYGLIDKIQGD